MTFSQYIEQKVIEREIGKLRDEQLVLFKKHKDLEMEVVPSGFDLTPLNTKEMTALKNNLML